MNIKRFLVPGVAGLALAGTHANAALPEIFTDFTAIGTSAGGYLTTAIAIGITLFGWAVFRRIMSKGSR